MLDNYKLKISYFNDGKQYASSKDKTGHYIIDVDASADGIKCILKPTVDMDNIKFTLTYDYSYGDNTVVFANGYQSWTDSREFSKNDVMPPLTKLCTTFDFISHSSCYGDYKFTTYTKEKGVFHGFSYGYIRNENEFEVIGSLNERSGYTIFYYDMKSNIVLVQKDLEGLALQAGSEYEIMNIIYLKGGYDDVFDTYFKALNIEPCGKKSITGYTSWYNYGPLINEEIINRDFDALAKLDNKLDIFQIDDGYQTAIGDWLSVDPIKFPNGLKCIADKAHSVGMRAGLWLAPFCAVRKSNIFADHADWLIKNSKGNEAMIGANWGGFAALDIYNEEVRAYLKECFDTILKDWGFDMVKLDFLYACSITPYNGKTRGEIMCDAMDLLRELVGDKQILGCGVPLFPAFGKVDFCRIGCDVAYYWAPYNYFNRLHRENVGVEGTLNSSIFRRHLDGRAFINDPDVILLRRGNIHLEPEQQKLMALINKVAGNILFVSDNIGEYDANQSQVFNKFVSKTPARIIDAKYISANIVNIKYEIGDETDEVSFNIRTGKEIVYGSTPVADDTLIGE